MRYHLQGFRKEVAYLKRIDHIDATILHLLQEQGRIKRKDIAQRVNLSVPAVSDRLRKLEERGIITGYHASVDAKQLDYDVMAFIRVSVDTSSRYEPLMNYLGECDEIIEVHSITGEGSHILKARTRNTGSLENLLSRIQAWPGVTSTHTSIVLSSYKERQSLRVIPEPGIRTRSSALRRTVP